MDDFLKDLADAQRNLAAHVKADEYDEVELDIAAMQSILEDLQNAIEDARDIEPEEDETE